MSRLCTLIGSFLKKHEFKNGPNFFNLGVPLRVGQSVPAFIALQKAIKSSSSVPHAKYCFQQKKLLYQNYLYNSSRIIGRKITRLVPQDKANTDCRNTLFCCKTTLISHFDYWRKPDLLLSLVQILSVIQQNWLAFFLPKVP